MSDPPSLYLVTEAGLDPSVLRAALGAGAVACVLVTAFDGDQRLGDMIRTIQGEGAAAMLMNDIAAVARNGADGVHVGSANLQAALRSLKPAGIVGAGGLLTRHEAMDAAERGVDYLMFGDPLSADETPLEARLEAVAWWSEIFQVPCVAVAHGMQEISAFASAGADFVALGDPIWTYPDGAAAGIQAAHHALREGAALRPADRAEDR